MDTLTTKGLTKEYIKAAILHTEASYPSRKTQNDRWRAWLATGDNQEKLLNKYPDIDIEAAFLSTCRDDMLYCGACVLSTAISNLIKPNK